MLPPPSPRITHGSDWFGAPPAGEPEIDPRAANVALTAPLSGSIENRLPAWSPTRRVGSPMRLGSPTAGAPSGLREGAVPQIIRPVVASSAYSALPAAAITCS